MILISNIKKFTQAVQDAIEVIEMNRVVITDKDFEMFVTEDGFKSGVGFIGVLPSSNPYGEDEDRTEFSENMNFYIVKKWMVNDGYTAFVKIVEETQQVTIAIIDLLTKSHQDCKKFDQMHNIKFNKLSVEPVSQYHGTCGYVISFDIINVYK